MPRIIYFIMPLIFFIGMCITSCNNDDFIQDPPEIVLDSESGVYTVKVDKELTIAPDFKNVDGAKFEWTENGRVVSTEPVFTKTWNELGKHIIDLKVTASGGSATEEILVEVLELETPVITFPFTGTEMQVKTGTQYVLTPEVTNTETDNFKIEWTVDGKTAGSEITFTYKAETAGDYVVEVKASNADGEAVKSFTLKVMDTLPLNLSFPTPSYFVESTTRYTFANRTLFLTPLMDKYDDCEFEWRVDGVKDDCEASTFEFTPQKSGKYIVSVTVNNKSTALVEVVCVEATESQRYRKASSSSSPLSNKVYEYVPAPGQFIGETRTGGMTGNETTHEAAVGWAANRLENNRFVSLGGFGGYIIVGFDHSIPLSDNDYDFTVGGNAFLNAATGSGGSNEAGIVYVMQDVNGNGLPDDEWYELKGSENGKATTRRDYAVTYTRPSAPKMKVPWTDNYGGSGTIDYLASFHKQDYYYPAWIEADSYTLRGTCLGSRTTQDSSSGMWDNSAFDWGYADNFGSDNIKGDDVVTGSGQRNGFKIKNAIQSNGSEIKLEYIDFIKVQTGVNSKAGALGEVSTEVFSFRDLSL